METAAVIPLFFLGETPVCEFGKKKKKTQKNLPHLSTCIKIMLSSAPQESSCIRPVGVVQWGVTVLEQ